ncbi:ATP-dependent RNA helicase Dbl8 [Schizosaccharomyces osmophilus]|uniref:ATP-dependent RNA helicase Dbl8 n=1 Tax=Schizosaccharomyces osmophilus TaxID=2545709 RepID=A0AAE9WF01_9SCHI|nr:ATP-dependent RNA helicase Dbl8 [Schizosaccharomyces osmophilus]WBW73992.1 ATP-dependent RNA helicase Dbl8 [Schizosaccharomyces osmophilus]
MEDSKLFQELEQSIQDNQNSPSFKGSNKVLHLALSYLNVKRQDAHWVCNSRSKIAVRECFFLFSFQDENDFLTWFKKHLDERLQACPSCILSYHHLVDEFKTICLNIFNFEPDTLSIVLEKILQWDVSRLTKVLQRIPKVDSSTSSKPILCAFYEILYNVEFLKNETLFALFRKRFLEAGFLRLSKKLVPGVVYLLFSDDEALRKWAFGILNGSEIIPANEFLNLQAPFLEEIRAIISNAANERFVKRFLNGFSALLNNVSSEYFDSLGKHGFEPISFVLRGLNKAPLGQYSSYVNCLHFLLKCYRTVFWRASNLEPSQLINLVFDSEAHKHWLEQMIQGNEDCESEMLNWTIPFLKSISLEKHMPSVQILLEKCNVPLNEAKELTYASNPLFNSICEIYSWLFNEYFETISHCEDSQKAYVESFQLIICSNFDVFFSNLKDYVSPFEQHSFRKAFEYRLNVDVYALRHTYRNYTQKRKIRNLDLKFTEKSLSVFWKKLLSLLVERSHILANSILRSISSIYLIDKLDSPETNDYSKAVDSFYQFLSKMLIIIQRWNLSSLKSLLDNPYNFSALLGFLFSPISDISNNAWTIVNLISVAENTSDAIDKLLKHRFSDSLRALSNIYSQWIKYRDFNSVKRLIYQGKMFINRLFHPLNGLLHGSSISFKDEENCNALKAYWDNLWKFFAHFFIVLPSWPVKKEKDVLVDIMHVSLDCCQMLIKSFNQVSEFINGIDISVSHSKSEASDDSKKALANSILNSLITLSYWLKLNDSNLLSSVVRIICGMLKLFNNLSLPINQNTVDMIQKSSTAGDGSTILALSEREDLFLAISPYLPEHLQTKPFHLTTEETSNVGEAALTSPDIYVIDEEPKQQEIPYSKLQQAHTKPVPANEDKGAANHFTLSSKMLSKLEKKKDTTEQPQLARRNYIQKVGSKPANLGIGDLSELQSHRALNKLDAVAPLKKPNLEPKRNLQLTSNDAESSESESESESDSDSNNKENENDGLFSLMRDASNQNKTNAPRRQVQLLDINSLKTNNVVHPAQRHREAHQSIYTSRHRLFPDIQGFYRILLSWNPLLSSETAADEKNLSCRSIETSYSSPEIYEKTFMPFLFNECWAQIRAAIEESQYTPLELTLNSRTSVDNFVEIGFTSRTITELQYLSDTDICVLSKSKKPSSPEKNDTSTLAKIQSLTRKKESIDIFVRVNSDAKSLQEMIPGARFYLQKLFSATTSLREYSALKSLSYISLSRDILNANVIKSLDGADNEGLKKVMSSYGTNEPQAKAISAASSREGFTLVQGPPGTGKTKTILGMIGAILTSKGQGLRFAAPGQLNPVQQKQKNRVLICAPSNAAIDEILMRLKDGVYDHEGIKFMPKVIRIGFTESINVHAKEFTLEEQMAKQMEITNLKKHEGSSDSGELRKKHDAILLERNKLRESVDSVRQAGKDSSTLELKLREVTRQKNALEQSLDEMRNRQQSANRSMDVAKKQIQLQLLQDADVVCATLSASGHETLLNANISFPTVIIDEAAQAVELSSLIPLKYECKRCIMVGDPNQLPPTVLSKSASKNGYDQSLYVRMFKRNPSNTYLLSIQYRMHPEISKFPSHYFYQSKLIDGPNMVSVADRPWHHDALFGVYRFFNVVSRESISRSKSLYNADEASFVLLLYEKLSQNFINIDFEGKIGIVTPYRSQVQELRYQFQKKFGSVIFKYLDIHTVDGFQGQEKDIIIFSCVRSSMGNGIGFLQDVRRLNVALTRARSSLYIVGSTEPLMQNEVFRNLIEDAKTRKCWMRVTFEQLLHWKSDTRKANSKSIKEHNNEGDDLIREKSDSLPRNERSPSLTPYAEPKQEIINAPTSSGSNNIAKDKELTRRPGNVKKPDMINSILPKDPSKEKKEDKKQKGTDDSSMPQNKRERSFGDPTDSRKPKKPKGEKKQDDDQKTSKKSKKPKSKLALAAMARGFRPPT